MLVSNDYLDALSVVTVTEAHLWMAERVRQFLDHWQHEGFGFAEARTLICLDLAYVAGRYGEDAQRNAYRLYGAVHPLVLFMTKDERRGRQFLFEFTEPELQHAAARAGGLYSGVREGALV